jgi:BirA family biotin operon repressor/biotin-[acetyl-CoA-carboxylase] ligase
MDFLPSAEALGLVALHHRATTTSTMDDAHRLAMDGAAAGTLVVADQQQTGRGRAGRVWASASGAGLWMTLIERPHDREMLDVLALRLGLALAEALDRFVPSSVRLKWPNDLYVGDGKLAGILVEARWRDDIVDWVAIGVGVNMCVPVEFSAAASVRADVSRASLLAALVPALRAAASRTGLLSPAELAAWRARDLAVGRQIGAPQVGVVQGIASNGALLVRRDDTHEIDSVRSGSMHFLDDASAST